VHFCFVTDSRRTHLSEFGLMALAYSHLGRAGINLAMEDTAPSGLEQISYGSWGHWGGLAIGGKDQTRWCWFVDVDGNWGRL
jgi:hypothetical protein